MNDFLYFIRDKLTGTHYFIYAFICLTLLFAIVGYLFKQKYAKVQFKLGTSQPVITTPVEENKNSKHEKKEKKKKGKKEKPAVTSAPQVTNQVAVNQGATIQQPQVVSNNSQPTSVNIAPPNMQSQQIVAQGNQPTSGLQQPTTLPNLNQPIPNTSQSTTTNQNIPEIIK